MFQKRGSLHETKPTLVSPHDENFDSWFPQIFNNKNVKFLGNQLLLNRRIGFIENDKKKVP